MFPKVNLRMILWATLAMALLVNYVTWLRDYPPAPPEAVTAPAANGAGPSAAPALGGSVPVLAAPAASAAQSAAQQGLSCFVAEGKFRECGSPANFHRCANSRRSSPWRNLSEVAIL